MVCSKEFYTTGVWVSAAAKAAVKTLITKEKVNKIDVVIPIGKRVTLPVSSRLLDGYAEAKGVKESPEADDVTHGAVIGARAFPFSGGVVVEGGEGIGLITKRGLKLPVGEKAINPVPRYFILKNIGELLRELSFSSGVRVEIFVEDGEKIAEKTINPKLGIVGGISILGTKGTIIPFSTKSFMDSIMTELSVARAQGLKEVVLAPGRESLESALSLKPDLPPEAFIAVGDFIYFAAKHAANMGFRRITFVAQPAKMAKVAYGMKNTHAKHGLLPLDWLADVLGIPEIAFCNTVREAFLMPEVRKRWKIVEELAKKILKTWTGLEADAITIFRG